MPMPLSMSRLAPLWVSSICVVVLCVVQPGGGEQYRAGRRQQVITTTSPVPQHATPSPTPAASASPSSLREVSMTIAVHQPSHVIGTTDASATITIEVNQTLAPLGADRFLRLVELGFYNNSAIFRVVPTFVAQWGISGDPAFNAEWGERSIADDPVLGSNTVGTIAFAAAPSPNTRTTEVYVNLGNNPGLDSQGFAVFGRVTQGIGVLQQFAVSNISQSVYTTRGNSWVHQAYPDVNFITGMSLDEPLVPSVAVGVPTLSPTAGFPGGCDGSGSGAGPGGGADGCVEANCSGANPPVQCALWCAACVPTITATCADIVCGGTCLVQNGVPICLTEGPTLTPTDQPTAPPVDPTTAPTTAVMRTEQAQNNAASAAASVGAFLIVVVGGMCLLNQCRSSETDASKYTAVGLTEELTPPGWDSEDEMEPTAYRGQTATTAL